MDEITNEQIINNNIDNLIETLEEKHKYPLLTSKLKDFQQERITDFDDLLYNIATLYCIGNIDKDYRNECNLYDSDYVSCSCCWTNYLRRGVE